MAETFNIADRELLLHPHAHLKKELVLVPDLNTSFWVRELTVKESLLYNKKIEENPDEQLIPLTYLLTFSVCDENGKSIFTEEDITALQDNSKETILLLAKKTIALTYRTEEATNSLKNDQESSSVSD